MVGCMEGCLAMRQPSLACARALGPWGFTWTTEERNS